MVNIPTETKNGEFSSYKIEGFAEVRDVPEGIPWNVFTELLEDNLNAWISIPSFDEQRNILHGFYWDYICIEYTDPKVRDSDKKVNKDGYKLVNLFQSEVFDKSRQIAKSVGEFEYNGKYYLVTSPRNTPLSNETNTERWIFHSVIIDKEKYDATKPQSEVIETSVKVTVKEIVSWSDS